MAVARKPRVDEKGWKSRQIGPNIVRAWFDSVINPVLQGLETERELIRKGNWTWRFRPPGLEVIHPVRAYVQPTAYANLKQFTQLNREAGQRIDLHDSKIPLLLDECAKLHRAIARDERFRELHCAVTSSDNLCELNVSDLSELFGAYGKEDQLELFAQYTTNNVGELGSYYAGARLWNPNRSVFLKVRDRPEIHKHYQSTAKAGDSLLGEVHRLIQLLEEKRLELSLEYDQPYVMATSPVALPEQSF